MTPRERAYFQHHLIEPMRIVSHPTLSTTLATTLLCGLAVFHRAFSDRIL